MPMIDLAHHIIAVANSEEIPVTNLQLQKVMYFTLQKAIDNESLTRKQLEEMYDEPFLVWRYGPVVKNIYDEYRKFGADPIIENDEMDREFGGLNDEIIKLLNENAFMLVDKSHRENFWKKNEPKINGWRSNVAYSLNDIR